MSDTPQDHIPDDLDAQTPPALSSEAAARLAAELFDTEAERADVLASADGPGPILATNPRIGEFSITRAIASGGMGTVYEARQENPTRSVALKVLKANAISPTNMRRFQAECQILGKLRHPAIATVYGAGVHEDPATGASLPYLAMELIPSARPITLYASDRQLELERRVRLFLHVCEGVQHGHKQGVIHRDLKPANILVDDAGWPKIIDFGIAKTADVDVAATTSTDVGQVVGTLQYMSPEQCHGDPLLLDARADVYALGVILYELLCHQVPYRVADMPVHQAMKVVTTEMPPRPSTIDRALRGDLEAIILKAMEKDLSRRYQSVNDLAEDLRRYLAGQPVLAQGGGLPSRLWRELLRRKDLLPVVLMTGLAITLALGLIAQIGGIPRAGAVMAAMLLPAIGLAISAFRLRKERDELRARLNATSQNLAGERARRRGAESDRVVIEKELVTLKRMTRRLLRDMDDTLRKSRADPALRASLRHMIRDRLGFKPGEAGKGHILAEPPTQTITDADREP